MWIQKKLKAEEVIAIGNVIHEKSAEINACEKMDLNFQDIYMVLVATNDHELNHAIVKACKKRGVLVNTCDDKSQCDFYFPAVTEVDGIVIGLNSGGKDPKKVREVRKKIEKMKAMMGSTVQKVPAAKPSASKFVDYKGVNKLPMQGGACTPK